MESNLNLVPGAKKFAELSNKYREVQTDKERSVIEKQIKELISDYVGRIGLNFNIKLDIKTKKIRKGHGNIIMPTHTLIQKALKNDEFRVQDFMYMDKHTTKKADGINILLDYSGSMWFPSDKDMIGSVLRIHCQNFLVLCISEYIQRSTNNKIRICVHVYANTTIKIADSYNIAQETWDGFIVTSQHPEYTAPEKVPVTISSKLCSESFGYWCQNEYIDMAFDKSLAEFRKMNMNKFLTLFFTDGGCSRVGETKKDQKKFFNDSITKMESNSKQTKMMWTFIQTQDDTLKEMLMDFGIKTVEIKEVVTYNKSFTSIAQTINSILR